MNRSQVPGPSTAAERKRHMRASQSEVQKEAVREKDRKRKAEKQKEDRSQLGKMNATPNIEVQSIAGEEEVHTFNELRVNPGIIEDNVVVVHVDENVGNAIPQVLRRSERIRKQESRAAETRDETLKRRDKDSARHRMRYQQSQSHRQESAKDYSLEVLDESLFEEYNCGNMEVVCSGCGAISFRDEFPAKNNMLTYCCQRDNVRLPDIKQSLIITSLLTDQHAKSKNFMENIRSFNSSLAFASMGAQISSPPGFGPYCFRIHGQIYHRAGTLHPEDGAPRKFAQLYILDPMEASRQRLNLRENAGCCEELMDELSTFMSLNNPFAKAYKMLHEVELEAQKEARRLNTTPSDVYMVIRQDKNQDLRRYNAPKVNEVAVIFQNPEGDPPLERDLLIHLRHNPNDPNLKKTKRVNILDNNLEPMTYPVLFPFGDEGWGPNLPLTRQTDRRKHVSQMEYYSHRFAIRPGFNPYLSGGKLTQQFFVDAYVKTEGNRLNYIRQNQAKLRVELYKGLVDHINSAAETRGIAPGKPIILPSSFQGSPRNMAQNYQDAMAIIRKYGKPDYFVTMTCNPKWKEIQENIEPYQSPENRPDIVARVFRMKLRRLLQQLKDGFLGKQVARIYVIEFQKRGLPHAHILIIVANEDKPKETDKIDKMVCAELPDVNTSPRLFALVTKHMIHGPCGSQNMRSPCMDSGKCTKDFPKQYQEETMANVGGYPKYRRRHNGRTAAVGNKIVDNRWVVPYNARLLLEYNCHINVEVCSSIESVKYLFKYVYKGHDRANIAVEESRDPLQLDELARFTDYRYVSPPEASWRLFAFKMHEQSHAVIRLHVHLQDEQAVTFNERDNVQDVLNRARERNTTLSAWFQLNQVDQDAHQYYYHEIPEHYVFKKGEWVKRRQGGDKVIGRMHSVNLSDTERFCLRLLLLHVRGATSYEDLRTVAGIIHDTFQEAAVAMHLLDNDEIWEQTLSEAAAHTMPKQLRQLFAIICVFACPPNLIALWELFQEEMSEDFSRKFRHCPTCRHCHNFALHDIQQTLNTHGKKCVDFGLPAPTSTQSSVQQSFDPFEEKLKGLDMYASLNEEQCAAFDAVYESTLDKTVRDKCFFIDGPGGSGKTYLYKALISTFRGKLKSVISVASTGIAANLLPGGRTHFSQFKLPVPLVETSTSSMRLSSADATAIRNATLVIWDESTMALSYAFTAIDKLLREIMQVDCLFGGKTVLLGGDFRQTLPVVIRGARYEIVGLCLKSSPIWDKVIKLSLVKNVRSVDPCYSNWLIKLGNGERLNSDELASDMVEIPNNMIAKEPIVEEIFGRELKTFEDVRKVSNSGILCPTNEDTHKINQLVLDVMNGGETIYLSSDSIDDETGEDRLNYPIEFLNGLRPTGMPPHELKLKVGAVVMLLRNLNTNAGLCNGTRMIVKSLQQNLIIAEVLTGSAEGEQVFIPRIQLAPNNCQDLPFVLRRKQFPVTLAFAMTINKSQGQTLDKVGIYLSEPVFGHGQLYVAFSRVRRAADVKVFVIDGNGQGQLLDSPKIFTKNVVYHEVLN